MIAEVTLLMKILTNKLTGTPLNYSVARAVWGEPSMRREATLLCFQWKDENGKVRSVASGATVDEFNPYGSWTDAGPVIEKLLIEITPVPGEVFASIADEHGHREYFVDTSMRCAAMRAAAASKLGDLVEIPDELLD